MQPWLYILMSVLVAAFVGGVTNHFAIQMLFHPRREYRIGGRRVPFTPGLIPKRKPEIAASLGDVVASYLVTAEGLKDLLATDAFRDAAFDKIAARLESAVSKEPGLTPRELALRWLNEDQWEQKKSGMAVWLRGLSERGMDWLWNEKGWSQLKLSEAIPGWSEDSVSRLSTRAEQLIIQSLKDEIRSPNGQRLLRKLTSGLLDKAGGFLGALAGMFMDEDKLLSRLTPVLLEQLDSEHVRQAVRGMIAKQLSSAGDWTLEEAVSKLSSGEPSLIWLKSKAGAALRFEEWLGQLEQFDISRWLRENNVLWHGWLRSALHAGIGLLDRNMHTIIEAISLPKLVKEQVEKFPIERLEQVILSVSGKEFRAITWLGAVLGGMIGLMQSLFVLWMQ
ncbi:DUF445 domain-containing protein [Paenibacillus abyssi]|uniref:UPF0754 membrane protein YheB n=1 Tax=Paenibacillus abyssi TaxID=1340531 RepID=A0A917LIC5_9BACL|nr:DUF445 family protein [Paenibacillus abyssi]GGG26546.1 UPF0754 membrane protein YheB [Paenibacillus abyssi]